MSKLIPLTQGKFAIVDDEDFEVLSKYRWQYRDGYAIRNYYSGTIDGKKKYKIIRMHRFLNETPDGMHTDHIDMDGLNNKKSNLRTATQSENSMNRKSYKNSSSKFKGVHWSKKAEKWESAIRINNKPKWLGYFGSEEEAAKSYNEAAINIFGSFARINKFA